MSPRVRALLALVALAAALRLGLALLGGDPASGLAPPLVAFDPAAVTRVRLARGERQVTLEREPGGWALVAAAGRAPAQADAVEALLQRVGSWRRDRRAGDDPARHVEWGVDGPTARRVRLEGPPGAPGAPDAVELLVGTIAGVEREAALATGGRLDTGRLGLFVRAAEEPATWIVSDFVTRELEPDPAVWLAPPLPRAGPGAVRRLAVQGPGHAATVLLAPDQPARLEGDARLPDPARVRALLAAALELTARDVAPPGPPPASALRLEVTLDDGRRGAAALWQDGAAWRAAPLDAGGSPGAPLVVEPALAARVAELARDLVRRRLVYSDPRHGRRVHVVTRDAEWTLSRLPVATHGRDAGWLLVTTGLRRPLTWRQLDQAAALPLLERVHGLEAAAWDPAAPAPTSDPWLRVTLVDDRRDRADVTLGDPVDRGAGGSAPDHDAVRRLPGRASTAAAPFWVDRATVEAMLLALDEASR